MRFCVVRESVLDNTGVNKCTYIASSLSSLLGVLSQNKDLSYGQLIYLPFPRTLRKSVRNRDLQAEIFIARTIAECFGIEICVKDFKDNWVSNIKFKNLVIDLNTIAHSQIKSYILYKYNLQVVGFGPEHLSAFYPKFPTIKLKAYLQKRKVQVVYFNNTAVHEVVTFFNAQTGRLKAIKINDFSYRQFCSELVFRLERSKKFEFLSQLYENLQSSKGSRLYLYLPVPEHYGGVIQDDLLIYAYIKKLLRNNIDWILVKNHPSDSNQHLSEFVGVKTIINWCDPVARMFPAELIESITPENTYVFACSSTVLFSPQTSKKYMYYPNSKYGRKLAKSHTNHLLRFFPQIKTITL